MCSALACLQNPDVGNILNGHKALQAVDSGQLPLLGPSTFATFGLLSPALKTQQLAAARQALAMPAANPQACEDAAAFQIGRAHV